MSVVGYVIRYPLVVIIGLIWYGRLCVKRIGKVGVTHDAAHAACSAVCIWN